MTVCRALPCLPVRDASLSLLESGDDLGFSGVFSDVLQLLEPATS